MLADACATSADCLGDPLLVQDRKKIKPPNGGLISK
jgi:hypothetical protein